MIMRHLLILATAVLLGQSSAVYAQPYDNSVASVDSWYRTYLGRSALNDPGAAGWINLMRQGNTPTSVIAGILGTDEYFSRVGGTMPAFIQALYREALQQPLSQTAYNFWLQRAYTQTRQQIAYDVLMLNGAGGPIAAPPPTVVPDRERERWQHHDEHDYRRPYYPFRR
jgi:hypothetical protein